MLAAMDDAERLTLIRAELRFELGLLHDRVNALLAAEAFLTIAYTAAMSNSASWSRPFAMVVAPTLSLLGLLLALLARPGVSTTARVVLAWTEDQEELLTREAERAARAGERPFRVPGVGDLQVAQRRSLLFFRAVPAVFAVVWAALTVVALVLTW
jgi:hypothetical protein